MRNDNDTNDSAEQSHIEHSNPKEKSQEQQQIIMDNKTIKIKNICRKSLTMKIQFGSMLEN